MRPLAVTMQAFGPYPRTQELDFADLRGAGFFLITGPTGAGKTTILDAMSFALYGETSGGEKDGGRSGAAMRSDLAEPGALTRVRLDFSLGDDLYRAERVPEQQRPKVKGEGTTTHLQEATLWRLRRAGDAGEPNCASLQPDGAPLASGWKKVTGMAEDLLGFRAEQFRQVVMLPQGRFQQFLEADSGQREQILRALFETGHYADIERALHDEALDIKRRADTNRAKREEILDQAGSENAEALSERCALLAVDHADACELLDKAERDDKAAQNALADGKAAEQVLSERDAAVAAATGLEGREAEMQELRGEVEAAQRAAEVADVARQADEAAAELEAARAAAEAAATAADSAAAALTAARAALATEESRAAERQHADDEVRRLESFEKGVGALAQARTTLTDAEAVLAKIAAACERDDAAWTAARDHAAALEAAWGEAQAGLLAAGLSEGEPCPVCGATDHPAPAPLPEEAPSQADVEAARGAAAAALQRRDDAREKLRAAEAAQAAAAALTDERAAAVPPELADPTRLAAALSEARREAKALTEAYEAAKATVHDREMAASTATAEQKAAAKSLARAEKRAGGARELLTRRLVACGFATEEDFAAAARPPEVLEKLAAQVKDHDDAKLRAAERRRLAEKAAKGVKPPRLEELEEAAAASSAIAAAARDAAATLRAQAEAAQRLLERLCALDDEAAGLAAKYESIGRLADVAAGRNGRRISFQSYVLGAFLDDVLATASERLRLMTRNRFSLERTEERTRRRQSAGLDLAVYDAWTGTSRAVSTLSGGEKFMAALSLALGLAEVVQAIAGGIRLETVFVDEGFGSLDDEALDLAVSALEGLHAGGRLVGIISHVGELRERIDARLEVTAGKSGSEARFVVP